MIELDFHLLSQTSDGLNRRWSWCFPANPELAPFRPVALTARLGRPRVEEIRLVPQRLRQRLHPQVQVQAGSDPSAKHLPLLTFTH